MRTSAIACTTLCILTGCASELAQRPAAQDPTSPAAAEAPYRRPPAYEPDPLLATPSAEAAKPPPPAATGYTCPMHPEVHSPTPGACPKCGMTLVPEPVHKDGAP